MSVLFYTQSQYSLWRAVLMFSLKKCYKLDPTEKIIRIHHYNPQLTSLMPISTSNPSLLLSLPPFLPSFLFYFLPSFFSSFLPSFLPSFNFPFLFASFFSFLFFLPSFLPASLLSFLHLIFFLSYSSCHSYYFPSSHPDLPLTSVVKVSVELFKTFAKLFLTFNASRNSSSLIARVRVESVVRS